MINENLSWPVRSLNGQLWITLLLGGGASWYTLLFWKAQLGLNALLFSGFLLLAVWLLYPEMRSARRIWLAMAGVLLSAIAVVWQHSILAQLTHVVSIFLLLGFAQARELRFLGFAMILAISSLLSIPVTWWRRWEKQYEATFRSLGTWTYLAILPAVFVGFVFYHLLLCQCGVCGLGGYFPELVAEDQPLEKPRFIFTRFIVDQCLDLVFRLDARIAGTRAALFPVESPQETHP